MSLFEEQKISTARKFLESLRPSNWLSDNQWSNVWIFRGQADSTWKLTPKFWRVNKSALINDHEDIYSKLWDNIKKILDDITPPERFYDKKSEFVNLIKTKYLETTLLIQWARLANDCGLYIPNFHQLDSLYYIKDFIPKAIDRLNYEIGVFGQTQYDKDAPSLLVDPQIVALAQHHGMPTHLLDWSLDPLVACFFAAEEVATKIRLGDYPTDKFITVYALPREQGLETIEINGNQVKNIMKVVLLPRFDNVRLHAQHGIFTLDLCSDYHYLKNGRFLDLEQSLTASLDYFNSKPQIRPKKITLPHSEIPQLMRLLDAEGVTRARLMPGYDSVTTSLEARTFVMRKWKLK